MSFQITEAQVKQFSANVIHLSQQMGSRLENAVRRENQKGVAQAFERIGQVTAQVKVSRHSDTPLTDTPHSRRWVFLKDYEHADLLDKADEIKILIDPTSEYAKAFVWAFGRAKDDEIIDASDGLAFSGENGTTSVAHPNSQKLVSVSAGAGANLNVQALRRAKKKFGDADVDESIKLYAAISSSQVDSLLGQTEVTSADYNTVRALVMGEVDSFVGFQFIRTQRLNYQSGALLFNTTTGSVGAGAGDANGYRKCIFWAEDGLMLSTGMDVTTDIGPRRDKSMSMQVFCAMGVGSARLEEEKVVIVLANEA
jgi:hypothetical protein